MESRGMIGREKEGWREGDDRELEGKGRERDGRERDDGGGKRGAKRGR